MTSNKSKKLVSGGADGGAGGAGFAVGDDHGRKAPATRRKRAQPAVSSDVSVEQPSQVLEEDIIVESPVEIEADLLKNEPTSAVMEEEIESNPELENKKIMLALSAVDARVSRETAADKKVKYAFRKGDTLYVKSLDLRGIVSNVYVIKGMKGYILDLVSAKGEPIDGRAMAMENDVVPVDVMPPQSEYDEARALVKSLADRFDAARSRFANSPVYLHVNPLTNQEDADGIVGLQESIVGILDHKALLNYFKDANIRRHYRALQNAMAALGGAYNIMSDALKRIDALREQLEVDDLYSIRTDAQENAYDRIVAAGNFLREALQVEPPVKVQKINSPTTLDLEQPQPSRTENYDDEPPTADPAGKYAPEFIKSVKTYNINNRALKVRKGIEEIIERLRSDDESFVSDYEVSTLRTSIKALQSKMVSAPPSIKGLFIKLNERIDEVADVTEYVQALENGEMEDDTDVDIAELHDTSVDSLDEISNLLSDLDLELAF